jgi:hypothetical protein
MPPGEDPAPTQRADQDQPKPPAPACAQARLKTSVFTRSATPTIGSRTLGMKKPIQYRIMLATATISVCIDSPYGATGMLPTFMASLYEPNCGGFYPSVRDYRDYLHYLSAPRSSCSLSHENYLLGDLSVRSLRTGTSFNPPGFPPEFPWSVSTHEIRDLLRLTTWSREVFSDHHKKTEDRTSTANASIWMPMDVFLRKVYNT